MRSPDTGQGPRTVAFESEQIFAGPKDRLDALADRSEVQVRPRLVFAAGTEDCGVQLAGGTCEIAAGIPLVTEQRLASGAPASGEQLEAHHTFVTFGRGEGERTRGPVGGKDPVQPKPLKKSANARRDSRSRRPRQAPSA